MQDLDKVLDFLVKSGSDSLQLAGGEPTTHPEFEKLLIRVLERGMRVNLLSNALWTCEKNELFAKTSPTRLGFLLNIDHPNTYSTSEWERIHANLYKLQGRGNLTLSFNIFERNPKYEYVFDLVSRYGIKNLRLSFSMPVISGKARNIYLNIEDYKALAPSVMDFVRRGETHGACVRMDNTVPICMFSKDELGELLLIGMLDPRRNFTCYPAIDIGPDLSVWRCFGTSGFFNKRLDEFNSLYEIYDYYERVFRYYQYKILPMKECIECKYALEGYCQGGCIGYSLARCMELGDCPKEITNEDMLESRPKLSSNLVVKEYDIPQKTLVLLLENRDITELNPSMRNLLDLLDGKRTLRRAIEIYMRESSSLVGNGDPLDAFLVGTVSEEMISIVGRLLDKGFLVLPEENKDKN